MAANVFQDDGSVMEMMIVKMLQMKKMENVHQENVI